MSEMTILVNTLMENRLASSLSEAQRMAEEMLSTSKKVTNELKEKAPTYAVKNFGTSNQNRNNEVNNFRDQAKRELSEQDDGLPSTDVEKLASKERVLNEKIDEIRDHALNPRPINVQVDFDTPQRDTSVDETSRESQFAKPAGSFSESDSIPVQASSVEENTLLQSDDKQSLEQSVTSTPVMTPEEYSTQQMNKFGAMSGSLNEVNQSAQLQTEPAKIQAVQSEVTASQPSQDVFKTPAQQDTTESVAEQTADFLSIRSDKTPNENVSQNNSFASDSLNLEVPRPISTQDVEQKSLSSNVSNSLESGFPKQSTTSMSQPPAQDSFSQQTPQSQQQQQQTRQSQQQAQSQSQESFGQEQSSSTSVVSQPFVEENIVEKTQEMPVEEKKKKAKFTPEEEKLQKDVDISKIFNFSNK